MTSRTPTNDEEPTAASIVGQAFGVDSRQFNVVNSYCVWNGAADPVAVCVGLLSISVQTIAGTSVSRRRMSGVAIAFTDQGGFYICVCRAI